MKNMSKKYLVIGNPINHSLSLLHNYWIKKNNIEAVYENKMTINDLKAYFQEFKKEITGVNVTVPFKKEVISYLDELSPEAQKTNLLILSI